MTAINLSIADGRRSFYQWDTDQFIVVSGLPVGSEIHFDMPNTDIPVALEVSEINSELMCKVPDELLQHSGSFTCWAQVSDDRGTRTVAQKTFSVKSREKPPGYVYTETEAKTFADLEKRISELELTPASASRIVDISMYADKWVGTESLYSQVVEIEGITEKSQVDLTPSVEQLSIFYNKDITFVTENYNSVVTVYAVGQKPTNDYTIQATVTEVNV